MIGPFREDYWFLSNFHPAQVVYEGDPYPTVEHAFQAAKTLDAAERLQVREAKTPGSARYRGKRVRLRPDWESVKIFILEDLVRQKFEDPDLRARLLATGTEELVEVNTWRDRFWGKCLDKRTGELTGLSHLGRILMRLRERMRREAAVEGAEVRQA